MISLPSPSSLNYWWNFGSLLGACLGIQIVTGLFLAMQYYNETSLSFFSIVRISQDVNFGWLLRMAHANGASAFFVCLYLHISRGFYYSSYSMNHAWMSGSSLFLLVMGSAFLGYVLPWGQMSFWGASVITSLIQAVPYLGTDIVMWLWGGFSVSGPTLTRFFTFHFLLPLVVFMGVMVHIFFLHATGSSNPLGVSSNMDKLEFHKNFSFKDVMGVMVFFVFYLSIVFILPWDLGDPENFIEANPLVTPVHIQPEWYFLFAYAILRSIPNKLGGVLALVASVAILYLMPFIDFSPSSSTLNLNSAPLSPSFYFWVFTSFVILLTWIGARPVEAPYIFIGQLLTFFYFFSYGVFYALNKYLHFILFAHTRFLKT